MTEIPQQKRESMKKSDYFGIAFLVLLALLIVFFPVNHTFLAKLTPNGCFVNGSFEWTGFTLKGLDQFGNVTRAAPYWMGFLKFALLAMFGEMVKNRIRTGFWHTDLLLVRTVTWGVFGMVMTIAFALFAGGVAGVMGTPLWFGGKDMGEIGNRLIFAISTSFWICMTCCGRKLSGWLSACTGNGCLSWIRPVRSEPA